MSLETRRVLAAIERLKKQGEPITGANIASIVKDVGRSTVYDVMTRLDRLHRQPVIVPPSACGDKRGSYAGFKKHDAAGEPPCRECREKLRAYTNKGYALRKTTGTARIRPPMTADQRRAARNAAGRKWRANNREKVKAYNDAYRAEKREKREG